MSMRINIRNFTGTTLPLDVDPTQTISDVKGLVAAAGKGKSVRVPALAFKGHELRDKRQLLHYDIAPKDTIHILPPSKKEKITLNFEKEDGTRFTLSVNSDIKMEQLKREISVEEKIDAKQLKVVSTQEDPEGDEVITLKDLEDTVVLSTLSLQDEVIAVYSSIQQIPSGPSAFGVLLSVDDRLELTTTDMLGVAIKSDQTLASFKEDVFHKYGLLLSNYTLILIGRELKDDDKTLGDLGFIPGCTVHAVAKVQFCVSTPSAGDFDFAASPMARISTIRKMLEEVDTSTQYDEYWFTLNGMDNLKESRTFWDLDIVSGTMILLKKRCYVTLTIRRPPITDWSSPHGGAGRMIDITAEETETVESLKQRIVVEFGTPGRTINLTHRLKVLSDSKTLKQENIESGDVLDAMIMVRTSSASGSFGGPAVDGAEFGFENAPAYS